MSEDKAEYNSTHPQAILERLGKPFPREAIKQRRAGNSSKALDYVEGHTVIRRLNAATNGKWSWSIKSFEFRPLPKTSNGNEQSLVVVTGELTIDGLGTRAGIGVQKVTENGGEDLVKGASTDALKKAATMFGVALDLYGDDYEDQPAAPASRPAPAARPQPPARPAPSQHPAVQAADALTDLGKPTGQPIDIVLADMRDMDEARTPFPQIKQFADAQLQRFDEVTGERIKAKLRDIAAKRKAAPQPPASFAG